MDISVIIPIYNVAEYLEQCLDSVAAAIRDLQVEVLLIDDGSTDSSGKKAKEYAKIDPRFRYFYKTNGGLGSARNFGVQKATGKYLMFIDSDDLVEPDIFTKLFALAEKTQSELTLCNMARIDSKGTRASTLSQRVYSNMPDEGSIHITRNRELFFDTIVTDKLILRSFYFAHGLQFPEKTTFEDIPVAMQMHCDANRVAFLKKAEYLWRERDGETKSITQRYAETQNLKERLAILERVYALFREKGDPELLENLHYKTLKVDLMIYINVLSEIPDEQAYAHIDLMNDFIDAYIDKDAVWKLPVTQRQRYRYLFERDLAGIRKTIDYHNKKLSGTKLIKEKDGYIFDLPNELFTVEDHFAEHDYADTEPNCSIDSMELDRNNLDIRSHLFDPKIPVEKEEDLQLEISLVGDVHKVKIPLTVIREKSDRVTEKYGPVFNENTQELDHYSYEFAGFLLQVDLNSLALPSIPADDYFFACRFRTPVREGRCVLRKAMDRYYEKYRSSLIKAGDKFVTIGFDAARQLYLHVSQSSTGADDGQKNRWRFLFPAREGDSVKKVRSERDGFVFTGKDNAGGPVLTKKECLPVWRITKAEENRLDYEIDIYTRDAGSRSAQLYAENVETGERQILSECTLRRKARKDCGEGTIVMDPAVLASLNIGEHVLYAALNGETGEELMSLEQFDHEMSFEGVSLYFLGEAGGRTVLHVFNEWRKGEKTKAERTQIRRLEYKQFRQEPLEEKTVLFESNGGEWLGGSPGAMYETIRKHHPDYICVWSLQNPRMQAEGDPVRVRKGSRDYYHYLATAKTLVTDTGFGGAFRKRGDQVLVQSPQDLPNGLK